MVSECWHADGKTMYVFKRPRHLWSFDPSPTIKSIVRAAFAVEPKLQLIALVQRQASAIEIFLDLKHVCKETREFIIAAAPVTAAVQFRDYVTFPGKEEQAGIGPRDRGLPLNLTRSPMSMLRPSETKALRLKSRLVAGRKLQSLRPEI